MDGLACPLTPLIVTNRPLISPNNARLALRQTGTTALPPTIACSSPKIDLPAGVLSGPSPKKKRLFRLMPCAYTLKTVYCRTASLDFGVGPLVVVTTLICCGGV